MTVAPYFLQFSTFMIGATTGITTVTGMPVREAKKGNLSWEGDRKNIETQGTTKDSFITQDRNEQIKGVKVEATFSKGHISLI